MMHPSELISAYLDGELSRDEMRALAEHLVGCGRCSEDLAEIQAVRSAVRSLPILELPLGIVPGAEAKILPHRNRGLWVGAAAAVAALVIAVASIFTPAPAPVSVDDLSSRFGARVSLDPAFGPAKVVVPELGTVGE